MYAVQGVLQYVSYQHLDPVTFNGLTQTKTLSAAFCCWLIIHKPQSPLQMVALCILFGSALVFQGYIKIDAFWKTPTIRNSTATMDGTTMAATTTAKETGRNSANETKGPGTTKDHWWMYGVIPCLGAAFLSGLAGALSQKGLQLTGIRGRDPFLFTVEISLFSAMTLLINLLRSNASNASKASDASYWEEQRAHWNWATLLPIFLKASSGVITALVHKNAGSVSKGFALMFGLVLSNMIQLTTKQESLQSYQVLGTFMIMLSTWLHFTNPP